MTTKKKSIKQRAKKAIVTQDNRFIYAKYDMNANELKFFMWIIAQINSQRDQLFKFCEIPLNEIMEIWQRNDKNPDYNYIRDLCKSMLKKTYIEDFKLIDENTMKEKSIFQGYTLFKSIRYEEEQGYISYQLNDTLMQYLLDLKGNFTQLKFDDIQRMKSAYSIRIYNMLLAELKQNRQNFKINLLALQNILEVPKIYIERWIDFKRFVLDQAKKDINAKSNIILLDIKTSKTGRKITDLEFIFDYKNNDKRIQRDKDKQESYNQALINILKDYIGKRVQFKALGELICDDYHINKETNKVSIILKRESDNKIFRANVKNFTDINNLQKAKDRADELFYLDTDKMQSLQEFKEQVKNGSLFKNIIKKI